MNIIEFIEFQNQQSLHLEDKNKAQAFLEATKKRIRANSSHLNDYKTDVTTMFNPLNIPEGYLLNLLNYYLNNGSFDVIGISDNKQDTQSFEEIKLKLQSIF